VPREPVAVAPLAAPAPLTAPSPAPLTAPAPAPPTAPAPAPTPPSEAPGKEPASTLTAVATKPADVAVAAPTEPAPAPPPKPAPPSAVTPTTMAPTPVPPVTPLRQLPTAAPSSEARTVMNTPPTVAPPASAPAPVPPQTAALTPVAVAGSSRVVFSAGTADLPDGAKSELYAVARQLSSNDHTRLQLVGYAGNSTDEANQARRISLQRALAVRTYLMEHGVANTRIDVRALGNRADGKEPPDRVDLVMLDR
jgi:outer membrane protein OmpA-like peptidoglycan-associated protein